MTQVHPFRFGVIVERMPATAGAWSALARRVESLGYATFLLRDHFIAEPFGDQFAPIAALTAAACATTTLRIGTLVIDNDYRHPVVLAKEAATLDLLSGGRFELGLGAGWLRDEYEQSGMPFDSPGARISRLEEAIQVVKGLFSGDPLTYTGAHYTIAHLSTFPRPVQRPHPPILVGGGGKRMLSIAAREADIIGMLNSSITTGSLANDPAERSPEAVAQKVEWVRQAAGERFSAIELSQIISPVLAENQHQAAEDFAHARGWNDISAKQVLDMPSVFIGSPTQIAEQMHTRRERYGFSYYVVADEDMEAFAPIVARLAGS